MPMNGGQRRIVKNQRELNWNLLMVPSNYYHFNLKEAVAA